MYKIIETTNINEATYCFETWNAIRDAQTWGDDITDPAIANNTIKAISGKTLNDLIFTGHYKKEVLGLDPYGHFESGVYYVFRHTKNGDKLMPLHVSMRMSTIINMEKFSKKYGSQAIANEL